MKFEIKNLEELNKFGNAIASVLDNGDVISLKGDLGAGKTTLVQFVGKALGVKEYITSPTFAIVNIYEGDKNINHMDLYRLEDPSELESIDFENYFYPEDITFIEWAEKGGYYIPDEIIEIEILVEEGKRVIEIKEDSYRAREIGESINENFSN